MLHSKIDTEGNRTRPDGYHIDVKTAAIDITKFTNKLTEAQMDNVLDHFFQGSKVNYDLWPNLNTKGAETGRFTCAKTCQTCAGKGTIDERLGGIATSNPEAPCPDCMSVKTCPDCKDGYYYPLMGPREACQTCTDYSKNCPDCNGTNYFLSHPEGTPGPCPTCN